MSKSSESSEYDNPPTPWGHTYNEGSTDFRPYDPPLILMACAPGLSASDSSRPIISVRYRRHLYTFSDHLLSQVAFPIYTTYGTGAAGSRFTEEFCFNNANDLSRHGQGMPSGVCSTTRLSKLDSLPTELLLIILSYLNPPDYLALICTDRQLRLAALAVPLAAQFVKDLAPWAMTPLCCFEFSTLSVYTAIQLRHFLSPQEYGSLRIGSEQGGGVAEMVMMNQLCGLGHNSNLKITLDPYSENILSGRRDAGILNYEWLFPRSKEYVLRNFTRREYVRGRGKFGVLSGSLLPEDPGLGMVLVMLSLRRWAGNEMEMVAWEVVQEEAEDWKELMVEVEEVGNFTEDLVKSASALDF